VVVLVGLECDGGLGGGVEMGGFRGAEWRGVEWSGVEGEVFWEGFVVGSWMVEGQLSRGTVWGGSWMVGRVAERWLVWVPLFSWVGHLSLCSWTGLLTLVAPVGHSGWESVT
jgi:hypothetical protein